MGTFAEFIESDAFFPILILLLVILMLTFVSIVSTNKKSDRKRLQERKKVKIDENAQVQLVQKDEKSANNELSDNLDKEIADDLEAVDISEVEKSSSDDIKEEVNEKQEEIVVENKEEVQEEKIEEPEEVKSEEIKIEKKKVEEPVEVKVDLTETEIDIPPYVKENENMEDAYEVPKNDTRVEESSESEVDIEKTSPVPKDSEVGEEFEVPHPSMPDESKEEPIIEDKNEKVEPVEAFGQTPNGDVSINTNIISEEPHGYVGEKTEILEFPDFDSLIKGDNQEVEGEVLNQANKYIESVMNGK